MKQIIFITIMVLELLLPYTIFSQTFKDDSLVVRQILDTNGLTAVSVDSVALKGNSGRIEELRIVGFSSFNILPASIKKLTALTELDISDGKINTIPPEIADLKNLFGLRLISTQIIDLPKEIGNLKLLNGLTLSRNQLKTIPKEIGNIESLFGLNLSHNQLTRLPDEISNLKKLTGICVDSNQLTELPDDIGNLSNLKGISLNYNQLTRIPENIGAADSFQFFSCEYNKLRSLPNSLAKLDPFKATIKICYNDSLVFTPEQKKAWGVETYRDYFKKYCLTTKTIENTDIKKQSNSSLTVTIERNQLVIHLLFSSQITCSLYDFKGRLISRLYSGFMNSGKHFIVNKPLNSPGIYYVQSVLENNQCILTKIVMLRQ